MTTPTSPIPTHRIMHLDAANPFASLSRQPLSIHPFLALLLLLLIATSPAFARPGVPHPGKNHDLKQQVEELEEQWRLALLKGDTATMDRLLSDDYIGISLNGQVNTKTQQIERTSSRRTSLTRLDLSDMKVKLIGSIAIVTSRAEVEGTSDSLPVRGVYRYTRVYQRLPNGTWKITSFEATRTPQAMPPVPATKPPSSTPN